MAEIPGSQLVGFDKLEEIVFFHLDWLRETETNVAPSARVDVTLDYVLQRVNKGQWNNSEDRESRKLLILEY